MIGKIKGKIDSIYADHVIIDTGGVGYLVYCSGTSLQKLLTGDAVEFYIETHVREDHIHLYGFFSYVEKSCFCTLQSVSGIGPRMALAILAALSVDQIQAAVADKNKDVFKMVSGVGPKLAERMIVELKGKLPLPGGLYDSNAAETSSLSSHAIAQDGISALVNLGINKSQAQSLVASILSQTPDISVSELITQSLKARG
jgi:Holliday junction DNA helicase RuvA